MKQKELVGFFDSYLKNKPLFLNKKVMQTAYTPDTLLHREEHINTIAKILAPCLRIEKPSNLFIYGKTGSGKTVSMKYIMEQMRETAKINKIPMKVVYINCKLKRVADTEYRLIAQLAREFDTDIPATGLPTDEVYKIFYKVLERETKFLVLVLDEIDQLVKKTGDEVLYNITRINEELEHAQITLVGISNDLVFIEHLDPRVRSSLGEEELVFPPYNALQLQAILRERSKLAFKDGAIVEGVIEKTSAYAARDHGDARRALDLLRVAGELAERDGKEVLSVEYIDRAENKIEGDRVTDILASQPKQYQAVLYSIMGIADFHADKIIFTGEVYDLYKQLCVKTNLRPLTQRRVSDVIAELDMLGIINAKVISKGRYGRTREISVAVEGDMLPKLKSLLEEGLGL